MTSGEQAPDEQIREILGTPRTIAVVGCSPDPARDIHRIARLLAERGHRIIPVNPSGGRILGRPVATSLGAIDAKWGPPRRRTFPSIGPPDASILGRSIADRTACWRPWDLISQLSVVALLRPCELNL